MNPADIATLIGAITALVTAVGATWAVIHHVNGPQHTQENPPVTPKP